MPTIFVVVVYASLLAVYLLHIGNFAQKRFLGSLFRQYKRCFPPASFQLADVQVSRLPTVDSEKLERKAVNDDMRYADEAISPNVIVMRIIIAPNDDRNRLKRDRECVATNRMCLTTFVRMNIWGLVLLIASESCVKI